jgi:hypothetical protein
MPFRRGGKPWRGESPREPRAHVGLNRRPEVADSRVEESPEDEGRSRGLSTWETAVARRFGARDASESRKGSGAFSNGKRARAPETVTRLHERKKALKGEPQERIRHEIRPADVEWMKASRG